MDQQDLWCAFLNRPSGESDAVLTPALLPSFAGRRILITGAGGSIGSALARALATAGPAHLVLLDVVEHGLYTLDQELSAAKQAPRRTLLLGSVVDRTLLREIFRDHRPEIVFHAAALKHVPLVEANPLAAAETNILGTEALLQTAIEASAGQVILLSTDKAADPISILGATKRLAERLALGSIAQTAVKTIRLPNVLGSSGSVGPLFVQQIRSSRPVTVAHPGVTRFFFTAAQTVETLLMAAATPEARGLLVPQTGASHRILDLARFLLDRVVSPPAGVPRITFTGLRPGDKLHEQMLSTHEIAGPPVAGTSLQPVTCAASSAVTSAETLARVQQAVLCRDREALLATLREAVPEYTPHPQAEAASEAESRNLNSHEVVTR